MNGKPLTCCACGCKSEVYDREHNPHAWDGWTIAPKEKCPTCNGFHEYEEEKKQKEMAFA